MNSSAFFIETFAEMQNHTVVEASDHANNTSEDAQARDTDIRADTPQRVHSGYPNNLQEAYEYDLRKSELLEKVLAEKTEHIDTVRSYTHQRERMLAKEKRRKRNLQEKYERERAYSACISQALLRTSPHHNPANGSEDHTTALTQQLLERTATIQYLERQNRNLRVILDDLETRMRNVRQKKPANQAEEKSVEDVRSQRQDSHQEPAACPCQESLPSRNILDTSTTAIIKPSRGILKTTSALMFSETRRVYFYRSECHPKVSSPDFKARVKRMIHYEQQALARRQYLVSIDLPDPIERPEQEVHSSNFASLRRQHEQEERRWFARKVEPMTSMEEE
jgi:hypothetical protein